VRVKELIIESGLDYSIILILEKIFYRFVEFNIESPSMTEIILIILFNLIDIKDEETFNNIKEETDEFINYITSENYLIGKYDQFLLGIVIIKRVFENHNIYDAEYLIKNILTFCEYSSEEFNSCENEVISLFNGDENCQPLSTDIIYSTYKTFERLCLNSL
jgi:hypothetical protein